MPRYLTPDCDKFVALLEHERLTDSTARLLHWLVYVTNPRTGRVEGATVAEIAQRLGWSPSKARRCLVALRDEAGTIDFHLPAGNGAGGWVRVLAFYDVMAPTQWLRRQRAIGDKRAREQARAELPPEPSCDDLADAGLIDDAVALAVQNARQRADALRALHRGRRPAESV